MSKRAEEMALSLYPFKGCMDLDKYATPDIDLNEDKRNACILGYEQAEKDILSIIESRLSELLGDAQPTPILRYELRDLIKKIKEED